MSDQERDEAFDPLSDPEERRVLYAALDSFRKYRQAAHYNITYLRRKSFYSLPSAHIDILSRPPFTLPKTFDAVDEAIDSNADISEAILEVGISSFGIDSNNESWQGQATPNDMDKARSTIRQLYRDWSAEGLPERHACHTPIFSALATHLPSVGPHQRHRYRVLVPGAGLGRLVLDICAAGYTVEGNEISYHQLLASNYILNCTRLPGQHTLYPWALSFSNHFSRSNQLRSVSVPDVHPAAELEERSAEIQSEVHYSERMSMTAGDFCALYKQDEYKNAFDAVAMCFFIDTAPNAISYVETIKHIIKPGGIWINLGPLLWHFESAPTPAEREKFDQQMDSKPNSAVGSGLSNFDANEGNRTNRGPGGIGEPGSFELSNEEVIALVESFDFEVLEHKQSPAGATGYMQDPTSMLQNVYQPTFWVAKKQG